MAKVPLQGNKKGGSVTNPAIFSLPSNKRFLQITKEKQMSSLNDATLSGLLLTC